MSSLYGDATGAGDLAGSVGNLGNVSGQLLAQQQKPDDTAALDKQRRDKYLKDSILQPGRRATILTSRTKPVYAPNLDPGNSGPTSNNPTAGI